MARGKSHGFSRVAAGTWDIFLSYGGDGHSELKFLQRRQDSCLVMMDTPESKRGLAGKYGRFWM